MHRIPPPVRNAARQTLTSATPTLPTQAPAQARMPSSALNGALQSRNRPISTVVSPTTHEAKQDGTVRITNPGHVQLQPSATDLARYPDLAPALGHSPVKSGASRESVKVAGEFTDGARFNVSGFRADPRPAGQDTVYQQTPGHVIDHGDMTPEQAQRYRAAQDQPVFPKYETSGKEGMNCVTGHAKLVQDILGHDVGPLHPHTRPQEMLDKVRNVTTTPPGNEPPHG